MQSRPWAGDDASVPEVSIRLSIDRGGQEVFAGSTSLSRMARTAGDLIHWLAKECSFPAGVILLTGTGVVPPDDFTLAVADVVHIDITGIGRLTNIVAARGE